MRKISVKKLAAVTGGVLLTASAIAPVFALTADEVDNFAYNAQGVPQANVVAGSGAAKSDLVWAGNIAAAVAANTPGQTKTSTCTASLSGATGTAGAASVSVSDLGARLTFSGEGMLAYDGELLDSADLNSDSGEVEYLDEVVTDSEYTKLTGSTLYYDNCLGKNTSLGYVEDYLTVTVDTYFDDDDEVDALVADIGPGDLVYTLTLGDCIPFTDNPSSCPDSEIIIPFMGKKYSIRNMDSSMVTLLEDQAGLKLYKGETIPGLLGVDGQEYIVEVGDVYSESTGSSDYYAELYLKDSAGNIVDTVQDNEGEIDFDGKLATAITLIEARKAETGTTESWVKIVVGSAQLELEDGENFPGNDAWTVTLDENGSHLCGIQVMNAGEDPDEFLDAVVEDTKFTYPMDFADVIFKGLTSEKTNTVILENGKLKFTDDAKKRHELILYEIDRTYRGNFEVDGKKWYYEVDTDLGEYCVGASTSVDVDIPSTCLGGSTTAYVTGVAQTLSLEGRSGVNFDYGIKITDKAVVDDPYDVAFVEWMLATGSWDIRGGHDLYFLGYNAADDGNFMNYTGDYFNENDSDEVAVTSDDLKKGQEYAVFMIDEARNLGYGEIDFLVDTHTGRLVDQDDFDGTAPEILSPGEEVQVFQDSGPDFKLSEDDSTDIQWGLTDYTTELQIKSGAFTATLPEAQRQVQVLIGSEEAASVVGESISLNEGETKTAEAGCTFTLNEVLYNATVTGGAGATGGTCNVTQQTYQALPSENKVEVFMDTATVPGKVIVVGGAIVNQAARALGVQLNAAGDMKLEIMGTSLVVAGYTADDTANAARQLINLLEA